ncbi:MAG: hypothetical protein C0601_05760 [Candidatus Muiribacterium halophilum]|uniref:Uncharacterized protein n=1 Tax=Muiribacterium halophilum TaxID=2053465 RepID=A0A2N5ZH57_MUIH1|nr:MAG: hypothetical protein C0601_05760 [Candidatus Muirbacterium halophilum]
MIKNKIIYLIIALLFLSNLIFADDLMIFGNKTFDVKNIKLDGDITRFVLENPDLSEGTSIDQALKLKVMGDLAPGIKINAVFDDTKVQNDNREITLFMTGKRFDGSIGDIMTSFKFSDLIYFNKKTQGIEIKDKKQNFYFLVAKSDGKIFSEIFTGKGAQQEYRLKFYPLVRGSETVLIDGKKLVKGTDYDIDYEDGSIFLENEVLPVESSSNIFVNYQYLEDEQAFKRYTYGLAYRRTYKRLDMGLNFFTDRDSKNSLIDDPSVKPNSHDNYSIFTKYNKERLNVDFESAFCTIDNNTLSDDNLVDRPIDTQANYLTIKYDSLVYDFTFKSQERDPGYSIIGKQEASVPMDQKTGIVSYTKDNIKLSYENTDLEQLVFNDPFLGITNAAPETFTKKIQNISYGFGNKIKVTGTSNQNDERAADGTNYESDVSSIKALYTKSDSLSFNLGVSKDEMENKTTLIKSKDLMKKDAGFNLQGSRGKLAYLFSDIEDKGDNIKNHNIDSQYFSGKLRSFISMKIRKEELKDQKVGDVSLNYQMTDDLSLMFRYNSSALLQLSGSNEVNVETILYNYKFDYSNDLYNVTSFHNLREKENKKTGQIENENILTTIDLSYNPYTFYTFRLKSTRVDNKNHRDIYFLSDDKNSLDITRTLDDRTNVVYTYRIDEKDDSRNTKNRYSETGNKISLKRTGARFEYSLSIESGERDYKSEQDYNNMIIGDFFKYNLNNYSNIKYTFSLREDKLENTLRYLEDELSFNRNINSKTFIKLYLKRRDVPEDDNGKAYSIDTLGISFDTNF